MNYVVFVWKRNRNSGERRITNRRVHIYAQYQSFFKRSLPRANDFLCRNGKSSASGAIDFIIPTQKKKLHQ